MPEPEFQHLRCRREGGVLVLTLAERQMQGDELADSIRREFFQAVEEAQVNRVVLDFQAVKYLGSAGFRPMLSLFRKLRDAGGAMILCNLAPEVHEVLQVTRLVTTSRAAPAPFDVAPTVAEAVERLQARPEGPA